MIKSGTRHDTRDSNFGISVVQYVETSCDEYIYIYIYDCRSYYRCTTQKCRVKKRVERSFEDPTTVITTYEGQHNHPVPTSLRSNYNSSSYIFTPSSSSSLGHVRSPQDWLLLHSSMPHGHGASNANSNHNNLHSYLQQQQQQQQNRQYHHLQLLPNASHDDYGLLQDIIPSSMFLKPQPRGQ